MSAKEIINRILSDNRMAKMFSAQMIMAARRGINPTIIMDGKKVTLVRTTQKAAGKGR